MTKLAVGGFSVVAIGRDTPQVSALVSAPWIRTGKQTSMVETWGLAIGYALPRVGMMLVGKQKPMVAMRGLETVKSEYRLVPKTGCLLPHQRRSKEEATDQQMLAVMAEMTDPCR
jgi:hypothetical protein